MKRFFIALVALIVFGAAAIVVAPNFIDWNGQRDRVAGLLASMFGRDVAITGELNLTLLPTPILSASDVRVGGDAGEAPLTLSAVEVALSPLSILGGEFRVLRAILVNPELHVVRADDGRLVWPIGSPDGSGATNRPVMLERVTVSNGKLSVRDTANRETLELTDIFAQFSGDLSTGEASLTGSLQAAGIPITVDLLSRAQSANGSLPVTLSLGIDGLDNELRYAGLVGRVESGSALSNVISGQWDKVRLQGDLALRGSDLSEAMVRLGLLTEQPAMLAQAFALDARFSARHGLAETDKLTFSLGDLEGSGSLTFSESESPAAVLTAVLNRLDMDSVFAMADSEGPLTAAQGVDRLLAWIKSGRPTGSNWLSGLADSEVRLSADRAALFGDELRNLRLRATVIDDGVSLSGLQATTPGGGDVRMRGEIDWSQPAGRFAVAASLDDAAFTPMAQWLGLITDGQDGPAISSVAMRGSIAGTPDDWRATGLELALDATTLTGSLSYTVDDEPALGVRIAADRLNADTFRPNDADGTGIAWLAAHPWVTGLRQSGPPVTINYDLRADEIFLDSRRITGAVARGSLNREVISLAEVSAEALAGAAVRISGRYRYADGQNGRTELEDTTADDTTIDISGSIISDDLASFASEMAIELPDLPPGPTSADLRARISGDLASQVKASVTGALGEFEINLGGSVDLSGEPSVDGAIRVIHPRSADVLAAYVPEYDPPGASGPFDFFTRLTGVRGDVAFSDLIGKVGPLVLAGDGTVQWVPGDSQNTPEIEATLRTGTVNATDWLPRSTARSVGRWSSDRLSFDWLKSANASVRIVGRSLNWDDVLLEEPAATVSVQNGELEVERFSADGWGGRIGFTGVLAPDPTGYSVKTRVDIVGADARSFLEQMVGSSAIDGGLDFGATVTASGVSVRDWVGQMDGSALLAVRDGTIEEMDLAEAARWVAADEEPVVFLDGLREALGTGETQFQALNARMSVSQGRLHTDDLRIAALETIASGTGFFDLNRWELDLTTDFALRRLPSAPPLALRLEGAADKPQRRWLTEAVQAYVAQRAARALSDQFVEPDSETDEEAPGDIDSVPAAEAALPIDQPAVQ